MPYQEHPHIATPADGLAIWRYMDLTKFIALLEDQSLYFSRLSTFADPLEGFLTRPTFERLGTLFGQDATTEQERLVGQDNIEAFRLARDLLYVSSWHMNEHESAAMWRLYLKSDEGIAIRSTVGRLRQALAPASQAVFIGAIQYVDYEQDQIPFESVMYLGLHKRRSFEYERELRAIVFQGSGLGQLVKADLGVLIAAVHLAPQSPEWISRVVEGVARRYGLAADVVHSGMDAGPIY